MITAVEYWELYEALVAQYEGEDMTRSDAQGCAEADIYKAFGVMMLDVARADRAAWIAEAQARGY